MPKYVTESGYEEFEDVRTRVGRNAPLPHRLWLVDVANGKAQRAEVRRPARHRRRSAGRAAQGRQAGSAQGQPRGAHRRPTATTAAPAIRWSDDGRNAAVMVRAIDNKDRWIATVDLADAPSCSRATASPIRPGSTGTSTTSAGCRTTARCGSCPSRRGYSHLYAAATAAAPRALTSGKWEASAPQLSRRRQQLLLRVQPRMAGRLRSLRGRPRRRRGARSHRARRRRGLRAVARRHASCWCAIRAATLPPQLAVRRPPAATACAQLTDTRTPEFKARDVDRAASTCRCRRKHGAGTIWGKFYGPATPEPGASIRS